MARILLVEDNELNRDMLSRRLERRGYEVSMAVDGMQALERADADRPDLILMDMSLPEIDGWEATRRLKASPTTAAIPVVALTAHAMAGDRDKALEAGCDDFDTKPVDFQRLLGKMEALLNRSEAMAHDANVPYLIRRTIEARMEQLPIALDGIDEVCLKAHASAHVLHDLRLILEEACVNVIRHAYEGRNPGDLTLELEYGPWEDHIAIRATVEDHGMRFDPLARAEPDIDAPIEDRPIGGLGVLLMRRLSDVQIYEYDAARGNCLTLVKFLDKQQPAT